MQGYLDHADEGSVAGWFTPNAKAYLKLDKRVFEISNGSFRPDLATLELPTNSGFLITKSELPELFHLLETIESPVRLQLFGDPECQRPLQPDGGLVIMKGQGLEHDLQVGPQGWIDAADQTSIRGWFGPESIAYISIDEHIFEISNGESRPDLIAHGLPANCGFTLTADSHPEIFKEIDSCLGLVYVRLFSDRLCKHPLQPASGVELRKQRQFSLPPNQDIASISGFSLSTLDDLRSEFYNQGFLAIPSFFSASEILAYEQHLDYLWSHRSTVEASIDIIDPRRNSELKTFAMATSADRDGPYKLNDLYLCDPMTRSLSLSPRLGAVLGYLTNGIIMQCNSLNFEYGSQQQYHFDTFYMPPPQEASLIVTSICIEDVSAKAGPLCYWPKSHLLTPWLNSAGTTHARDMYEHTQALLHFHRLAKPLDLRPETFLGKAGDVFIWHQQLLHGGAPIEDYAQTRKTLVSHYWSYPETPMPIDYEPVTCCSGFLKRAHKC